MNGVLAAQVRAMRPGVISLLLAGVLGAVDAIAVTASGSPVSGVTVTASGVSANGKAVAWADLALVALPRQPAQGCSGGVVTRQGEILRGLPTDLDQGALRWTSDQAGPRSQPLDSLAAIILGAVDFAALPALLAGEPGATLSNGERIAGALSFLNAEAVGLDTGRRVAQVPRGRISVIVLRPVEVVSAPCTWLLLASGDRILAGGTSELLAEAVVAAWRDGPGSVALTGQVPRRATAMDRQGAALPVRAGVGFPALVGGLATAAGVRVPARGEIAWSAAGQAHFMAWAACPRTVLATSAAVVLDGTVAWEQTVQPGAPAVAVAVPLRGAAEICLRTAAGSDGETARHEIVWGMPTLLK